MITGFNTNVRYQGRVFHVQTEDSGAKNPHIISHLYHGGTILASEKHDYSEKLGSEGLEAEVRGLMETQHKSMLKRLKNGDFDAVIAERLGGEAPASPPEAASAPAEAVTSPEFAEAAAPESAAQVGAPRGSDGARVFGDETGSRKPLDEVILDYLVQKARDRAARAKG